MSTDQPAPTLRLRELLAMGVGGMIGGGIFSVLGLAVRESGNAAPLAFLSGALIALIAGRAYVHLALAYREDGASFTYLERAFPKHLAVAGVAGWVVVVGYIGTLALYAYTFGAYGSHLLGHPDAHLLRMGLSVGVLLAFLGINALGAGAMGRLEDVLVGVKVVFLGALAVAGFAAYDPTKALPLVDRGVSSIFLGGALIFVAFEGFQLITNAVAETKEPDRNIPRGIYGSIVITTVIYVLVATVAVGTLGAQELQDAGEYALAVVAKPVLGPWGVIVVDIAAMLATASAINATLFGSARLARAMAKDRLAPKLFSFRARGDVPLAGIVVIAALAALLTSLGNLEMIASFSSMTFLLVSMGVCIASWRLRRETGAAPLGVGTALLLLGVALVLLVVFLAEKDRTALVFCGTVYAGVVVAHLLFERFGRAPASR
ncbi:MAG: amino acid permease [Planctomycetes bacterium]|nr:amino acid permease [Planctomycetota bacterium]